MAFKHGVYTSEIATALLAPRAVDSNVIFVVGTSQKGAYVNQPRLYNSYEEYVTEQGWDETRFSTYTLQEVIYSHFALYRGAPVVAVNVYDPKTTAHQSAVADEVVTFVGGQATLAHGTVSALVVKDSTGATTYVLDTDYTYDADSGALAVVEGGSIGATDTVKCSYTYGDASKVTSTEIIGGIDATTGKSKGMECVDDVFPLYRVIPGCILAPKYSETPAVAVVMAAKAENINGLFQAIALCDVPTVGTGVPTKYTEIPAYKQNNNLVSGRLIVCWPKVKLGDNVYHLSTHLAGLMSKTDYDNGGVPYANASNKVLNITSVGKENGTSWEELPLGLEKANYLNGEGIYTALNFDGGLRSWGGRMACYPTNTDPKDCQESIRRMFNWWRNTFILTYFQKVDSPLTKRMLKTIMKSEQMRIDGYVAREMLLGGEILFRDSDNPTTDLMDGIVRFHLMLTPPPAARAIECEFEFDTDNLSTLFG